MNTFHRSDRRQFLRASSALAAGSVVSLAGCSAMPPVAGPALHSPQNLQALARSMTGRLVMPDDEAFAMAAYPNNARWAHVRPKAIAMCANEEDVRLALRWAVDHGEPFAVRSGGHNYAGFSTTPGILINVKPINHVTLDERNGLAHVGAGVTNQNVADVMSATPFAIPSGRCPTVGVAGLVLGGGWGFAATRAGLTCDWLDSSDVVLANNQTVRAQSGGATDDLFWALRGGGGGNFGVNTAFSFRFKEVQDVTVFNITWPARDQVQMLRLLQQIQLQHGRDISTRTKALPSRRGARPRMDELVVTTLGLFWGNERQAREALAPALTRLKPLSADIRTMRYWHARDYMNTDDPIGLYDLRSSYIADTLSETGIETSLRWMTQWPGGSVLPENMGILFAIGGAVRDRKADDTAYVHRNANFIFEMECAWTAVDSPETVRAQRDWLAGYFDAMRPFVLPQAYVNFPNRDQPDWARAYYGSNLARLSRVKRKYDPQNVFRFQQSIPLA